MSDDTPTTRPSTWADPIKLEGAPNLHAVCGDLYRGAQPTEVGMLGLEAMGIETIVSLRAYHSDHNEIIKTGLGL